jgi:hypothetical protein
MRWVYYDGIGGLNVYIYLVGFVVFWVVVLFLWG